jgi:osmotically-inducible protein OsmY
MLLRRSTLVLLPLLAASTAMLSGCIAPVILGGAAVVSSTNDRRTLGTQVEDESIEIKAQKKFSDDPELKDKSNLHIISYNTTVLLFGQAETEALRAKAEQLVSDIPNKIHQIYNQIEVMQPTSLGRRSEDALMITNIKTQMITYPDLQASHVKLTVENGTAYLMGLVTRKQGQKAIEVARNARAVFKVVDLFEYIEEP